MSAASYAADDEGAASASPLDHVLGGGRVTCLAPSIGGGRRVVAVELSTNGQDFVPPADAAPACAFRATRRALVRHLSARRQAASASSSPAPGSTTARTLCRLEASYLLLEGGYATEYARSRRRTRRSRRSTSRTRRAAAAPPPTRRWRASRSAPGARSPPRRSASRSRSTGSSSPRRPTTPRMVASGVPQRSTTPRRRRSRRAAGAPGGTRIAVGGANLTGGSNYTCRLALDDWRRAPRGAGTLLVGGAAAPAGSGVGSGDASGEEGGSGAYAEDASGSGAGRCSDGAAAVVRCDSATLPLRPSSPKAWAATRWPRASCRSRFRSTGRTTPTRRCATTHGAAASRIARARGRGRRRAGGHRRHLGGGRTTAAGDGDAAVVVLPPPAAGRMARAHRRASAPIGR